MVEKKNKLIRIGMTVIIFGIILLIFISVLQVLAGCVGCVRKVTLLDYFAPLFPLGELLIITGIIMLIYNKIRKKNEKKII